MRDQQVKHLLSKLTGISLLKKAMPMVPGQVSLKNRRLIWHRYDANQMIAIPTIMKSEMDSLIEQFHSSYSQYAQGMDFGGMVFAFYANDSSVTEQDFSLIEGSNLPDETKKEFLRVAQFLTDHGVQLWWSPEQMANYMGRGDKSSINGSDLHRKTFGYAWGAQKQIDPERKIRQTQHLDPDKAMRLMNDDSTVAEMQAKNQRIVQVITGEKNGRFGIFFTDGSQLFSVVPDAYFDALKSGLAQQGQPLDENSGADKSILRDLKSGIEKFFTIQSQLHPDLKKERFLPNQKRFILDTPDDPKPKPVFGFNVGAGSAKKVGPAHDGRHLGNTEPDKRYIACLFNDGTMYWQKESDKSVRFPMTEAQVDTFNGWKKSYWVITNPDNFEWSFQDPQQEQQYRHDAGVMNQISDFLQAHSNTERHVASQKFQTVIIGPRFTNSSQIGEEQTIGTMSHPETFIEGLDNGQFVGKRGDWVVVKKEYNISSLSQLSTMPGQAVSGTGPLQGFPSLQQAISEVYTKYKVPAHILPDQKTIEAAQMAFSNAQKAFGTQAPQNIDQPLPGEQMAVVDNQTQQTTLQPVPQVVDQQNPSVPQKPQLEQRVMASKNVLFRTSAEIIRHLKGSG
jgi:hypothetical protein